MLLKNGELCFRSTTTDDPELLKLIEEESILKNMAESRSYHKPMPAEMIFRIEHEGRVIGEVSLKAIRWFNRKAMISIFLEPTSQSKGYGKSAMLAIMKFAFRKVNLYRLEAEVLEYNEVSRKMMEKLGFVMEGKLREAKYDAGRYWDIYRYGLLRSEYETLYK